MMISTESKENRSSRNLNKNNHKAREACRRSITLMACHLSTVKIDYSAIDAIVDNLNQCEIFMRLNAKNSFNMKLKQSTWCLVSTMGEFSDGFISE